MNDALFTPACGAFGEFGGMFVPEALVPPLEQLAAAYEDARRDPAFRAELDGLLGEYAGRPTPLYRCRNLTAGTPVRLYLKREDLLHGGAHAINQVLGQALLARRMGKTRLLADTGAGPHGVAAAFAGALFGLETVIYMGARDVARHGADIARMRVMGAAVVPVDAGAASLKDAVGEALRDWIASHERSHYVLGTAAGPHPFPTLVRDLQQVIGREARAQVLAREGRLPSAVIACVGGGSNAIGLFGGFLADPDVELVGVEASRPGLAPDASGAAITEGAIGVLHGARTRVRLDADGQVATSRSISAGLDYPALGPEHAHLAVTGRARYARATGAEALAAFHALARREGILPALESAHALSYALRRAREAATAEVLIVNLSGRGDKDLPYVQELLETSDAL